METMEAKALALVAEHGKQAVLDAFLDGAVIFTLGVTSQEEVEAIYNYVKGL